MTGIPGLVSSFEGGLELFSRSSNRLWQSIYTVTTRLKQLFSHIHHTATALANNVF